MKKLTPEEKMKRRQDRKFKNKIRNVFVTAGFEYLNTEGKEFEIGFRKAELDAIFRYKNLILICEYTGAKNKVKDHIRKKKEAFDEIKKNSLDFLNWICSTFPELDENIKSYDPDRYRIYNLYFSQYDLKLSEEDNFLFQGIKFIEPKTLDYFHRIMQCIKKSVRFEIFRFLDVKTDEIGVTSSESSTKLIKAPIICPKESIGLKNGVRIVSFMMSADSLIRTCYVMRKDNWEDTMWLYQRLIDKKKIKRIREFLAKKQETFFNNIIVGLPDEVRFVDDEGDSVSINKIGDFDHCQMVIPNEMNSICVIDGQHRIFAHHEGMENDSTEKTIAKLRDKLHLLVTGLIFPSDMEPAMKTKIQCEIFLDINSNAKPVPADVLLHIQRLKDPCSDIGLARQVIEQLNRESIFFDKFELSTLEKSKIKVASIVKFALKYLVTIKPSDGKVSLFNFWDGDKEALKRENKEAIKEYVKFCSSKLAEYFSAVRENFINEWHSTNSKILSVVSINGFIIAYYRQLEQNGIQKYGFYNKCFKNLKIDFSKEGFQYTSSQYRKFSSEIIREAFEMIEDESISA